MRRLPATTVYYGIEFVDRLPTWVVMAVYLVCVALLVLTGLYTIGVIVS